MAIEVVISERDNIMQDLAYEHNGFCSVCEKQVKFLARSTWYRDDLRCPNCDSMVRERAIALVLSEIRPNWRDLDIHESSPADRGISRKLRLECSNYVQSQFYVAEKLGAEINGFRNENLEKQTFSCDSFDIVITLDVMEHVFEPDTVYQEIFRTLKPGGIYLHTFPVSKNTSEGANRRAVMDARGNVHHIISPTYHGNPIDASGSLVTFDYGYDISKYISDWSKFDVRVMRFWDESHGIIGDYTEVFVCKKPSNFINT